MLLWHDDTVLTTKRYIYQSRTRKQRSQNYASKFRRWLVDKYGMTRLAGTNILDIGGGKGELSFELLHLVGVQSTTVIDPRSVDVSKYLKKLKSGRYTSNAMHHNFLNPVILKDMCKINDTNCSHERSDFGMLKSQIAKESNIWRYTSIVALLAGTRMPCLA